MPEPALPGCAGLAELYHSQLSARADDIALIDDDGPMSYREFDALCASTAA